MPKIAIIGGSGLDDPQILEEKTEKTAETEYGRPSSVLTGGKIGGVEVVILAAELGIPYQTIAMSTDYDCWKEDEAPVTFEMILARMKENAEKVKQLLVKVIPKI